MAILSVGAGKIYTTTGSAVDISQDGGDVSLVTDTISPLVPGAVEPGTPNSEPLPVDTPLPTDIPPPIDNPPLVEEPPPADTVDNPPPVDIPTDALPPDISLVDDPPPVDAPPDVPPVVEPPPVDDGLPSPDHPLDTSKQGLWTFAMNHLSEVDEMDLTIGKGHNGMSATLYMKLDPDGSGPKNEKIYHTTDKNLSDADLGFISDYIKSASVSLIDVSKQGHSTVMAFGHADTADASALATLNL
jgi:hypothetical protein